MRKFLLFFICLMVSASISCAQQKDTKESSGLFPIIQNGKVGYINKKGEIVINPQFDLAFPFSEGMAAVRSGERWGYIDKTGKIVINPQFDLAFPFSEGKALVARAKEKESLYKAPYYLGGYIDRTGKIAINPDFEPMFEIMRNFSEGLAAVFMYDQGTMHSSWGYVDTKGDIVIKPQFFPAHNFSEGIAPVGINGKLGYIDKTGKIAINPTFNYVSGAFLNNIFSEGLAAVKIGEKWGYIDKAGKIVINPQFVFAFPFSESLAAVLINDKKKEGKDLTPDELLESKVGYIDKTGKMVIKPQFGFQYYPYKIFGTYSLFLIQGTVKGGCINYLHYGGGIGLRDIQCMPLNFSEGLALINIDNKWGYIDKAGKIVINPQFDWAWNFFDGLAMVGIGDKLGYLDKTGRYVWNPTK
jgi:hypothetical protein